MLRVAASGNDPTEPQPRPPLIHILRASPSWATAAVTECGIAAPARCDTVAEFEAYLKADCRGSTQRAYATHCVTCVNQRGRGAYPLSRRPPEVEAAIRYLESPPRAIPGERLAAELAAIALLIGENPERFAGLVDEILATPKLHPDT